MDRRTFLGGVGTVGTLGSVGAGIAVHEPKATKARTEGLAQAAGTGNQLRRTSAADQATKALLVDGVTLGYLSGSAGMFATPGRERLMRGNAIGLRWAKWNASLAAQLNQSAIHTLFKVSSLVDLSIGVLRRPDTTAANALQGLEIRAHFAIDDAPHFVAFNAWRYEAATLSTARKSTQPISFSARVPDHVALEVNYALNPAVITSGTSHAGSLYLPIGATASGGGLATGLYILAAPSVSTGVPPQLSTYMFSGDAHAPVADPSGRALDFDYLALAIRPVAI